MKMRFWAALAAALFCIFNLALPAFAEEPVSVIYHTKEVTGPGVGTSFTIRTDNNHQSPQFAGGTVSFLSNDASMRQQLCGLFRAADGSLTVVDGGVPENADKLVSAISAAGGTVDAWLITHPQDDHVGALYEILHNRREGVEIKNIYYSFHNFMWYAETAPEEQGMVWNLMTEFDRMQAEGRETVLHPGLKRGDVITVSDSVSARVLNDPLRLDESVYAVNNSGLMYDLSFEGKHFFIPGDMGPDGGDILLSEGVIEGVTADYCVMSHHGQNGLSESFYRKLAPRACIWSCPPWIMDAAPGNTLGLKTYETKQWIQSMNIGENYCTYNSDIVLR